jgi:diguanylate cyclase (GGDEF)-like protein
LSAALRSAVAGLVDASAAQGDDPVASIHRLVLALLDAGVAEGRPDLQHAAEQVFAAASSELAALATAFIEQLPPEPPARGPGGEQVVLVVEDDVIFGATLQATLRVPGRRIEVVGTGAAARARLALGSVALVILDLILPDGDGRNLLLEIRSDPRTAGLALFVVSAKLGTQTKGECFALGADAYFEKPLDLQAFSVAVGARLERHTDRAQVARRDPVTGLANRAAFLESAGHLRAKSPPGTIFSLAVLDLDHFRWVEETWGRRFADSVLRRAGVRLAMTLRQAACFARWDGAEFIALFVGRTAVEAGLAVEQALDALRRVDFRQGREQPLTLTFSAGVVDAAPEQSLDDILAAADRLCYAAKAAGRSRVVAGDDGGAVPARKILVAEDDPDIARLLARQLRREGFDPLIYTDGAQALAAFPDSGAALVLSDIEMPDLDGLGLLRQLREHPAGRHLPIMMLTAMGDENYIVRAFELGADDYLIKPFSSRELTARIRRLLRRPSVTGVPAQV